MYIKPIKIEELSSLNHENVFLLKDWLLLYNTNALEVLGIYNAKNNLIGCFTSYLYKRAKLFNQIASPPFMPNNGLFYLNASEHTVTKNTFTKEVMETISLFLKQKKKSLIQFSLATNQQDVQPFIWKDFKTTTRYTYRLNVEVNKDVLWSNLSSKRRNNVTKAIQDGLTNKITGVNSDLVAIIKETYTNQNLKIDYDLLNRILTQFNPNHCFFSSVYDKQNNLLAANFIVYYKNIAYCLFSGYSKTNKHRGAGAFGLWSSILEAQKKNVTLFDFEGSMQPQIETYFRGFGGVLTPYYRVSIGNPYVEFLLNFKDKKRF